MTRTEDRVAPLKLDNITAEHRECLARHEPPQCDIDHEPMPCSTLQLVEVAKAARAVLDYDEPERWGGPHDWLAETIGYYRD